MINEKIIYKKLTSDKAIHNLVRSRVFPNLTGSNIKKPAVTYFKYGRSKNRLYQNGGEVTDRFQLSIYSRTYDEAKRIEGEVIRLFDGIEDAETLSFYKVTDSKDYYETDLNVIVVEVEITNF